MKEELIRLGMTKSEALVFELLVKYGRISGSQLAKKSGIDRSTTYNLLNSLNAKGFVSYTIKDNLKQYQISNPSNIKKIAEETVQIADSIIGQIKKSTQKNPSESLVEIYEGPDAPKVMYRHYMKGNHQKFYTYGGYGKMFSTLKTEIKQYLKAFIKKKNFLYSFISKDYPNKEKLKTIPGKIKKTSFESIPAGFTIGQESVVFHTYEDESQVILIKNPLIAKLMRELYQIAWGKAK